MPVHVSSEIGRPCAVLVHPPGTEPLAVTPTTQEVFLRDDVVALGTARPEHARFVAARERFATDYQACGLPDLLRPAPVAVGAIEGGAPAVRRHPSHANHQP